MNDPRKICFFNVWQIFDNLLRSFGEDVLQVLFNSIEGVAACSPDSLTFELMRYILDQVIAIIVFNILPKFLFFFELTYIIPCYFLNQSHLCTRSSSSQRQSLCPLVLLHITMRY